LVIAVACELPSQRGLPLSRHSAASIHEVVKAEGVAMSLRTVQRILAEDALKPWRYRSWIHPRDPDFRQKAEVVLGLYEGVWKGRRLGPSDLVVCADEKPSIQARRRSVTPPAPGRAGRVESDYQRRGALQYLCAWDVRRGLPWGRCEPRTGIAAFERLVDQVMAMKPYASARRVFWIVDNGSSYRGAKAARRLRQLTPTSSWCTSRCTPPGSTNRRSGSASCSARSSLPPLPTTSLSSAPASSPSRRGTASIPDPSHGGSLALTSAGGCGSSPHDPSPTYAREQ
jgi:hypothetical protein